MQNFIPRHVMQGDVVISDNKLDILTTLLGSCIAVCLYDKITTVGGMNHFLLPNAPTHHDEASIHFGSYSMEVLINGLLKKGAQRHNLEAKIFGGASVVASLAKVGQENINFVTEYLEYEEIPCISQSLGGTQARKIRFWPCSGKAQQQFIYDAHNIIVKEKTYSQKRTDDVKTWLNKTSSVSLF